MAIRPLFMRLRCEKCLGLNRSFVKNKGLPQISEVMLNANATQILALHLHLQRKMILITRYVT